MSSRGGGWGWVGGSTCLADKSVFLSFLVLTKPFLSTTKEVAGSSCFYPYLSFCPGHAWLGGMCGMVCVVGGGGVAEGEHDNG